MKKVLLVIHNVTLTSMLKRVDVAVQNIAKEAMDGNSQVEKQLLMV